MTNENKPQKDETRRLWHRPIQQDDKLKLRNTLNIIFMILAVASIIIYFVIPRPNGLPYFFICCFLAIIIKGIEVCIRMVTNKKNKR